MSRFEVFVKRATKRGEYNVKGYIPAVKAEDADSVLKNRKVRSAIAKTFGKKIILEVHDLKHFARWDEYHLIKPRAVI
jgi:hypothetical protein